MLLALQCRLGVLQVTTSSLRVHWLATASRCVHVALTRLPQDDPAGPRFNPASTAAGMPVGRIDA
jgi:hypothetical protein